MEQLTRKTLATWFALVACLLPAMAMADTRHMTLATATSPNDSGLLEHILPEFTEATGIRVEVIAVSSREALEMTSEGYVDAVISHLPNYERRIMNQRIGLLRRPFMSTDFVIAGPPADPARAREAESPADALRRVFDNRQLFLSRGDESGTHDREKRFWRANGVSDEDRSFSWYQMTRTGMFGTIHGAGRIGAYVLVDRPTWLQFGTGVGLDIIYEDPADRHLDDVYSIVVVNPDQVAGVDADAGRELADWLVSEAGRKLIRQFQVAGEPAYRPIDY